MPTRWLLAAISLLVVVGSLGYAAVTPYRQAGVLFSVPGPDGRPLSVPDIGAPDENRHANYVAHLLAGHGFPVLTPGAPDFDATYQAHQPPLYYLIAVGWSSLLGIDAEDEGQGFPLRALGAFFGVATALGLFACGRWGLGRDDVGLAAAVFALLPMHLALCGAVSNDPPLYALMAWGLAVCGLGLRHGWTPARTLWAGTIVGLAILTKTTGVALVPVVGLALLLAPERPHWTSLCGAGLLALALAGPWLARNHALYGDPLAIGTFNEAFGPQANSQRMIERVGAFTYWVHGVGSLTARSSVGVFGYMDIPLPDWCYRVSAAVAILLVAGWLRRGESGHRAFGWVALAQFLIVLALFVQFNRTYFQAQARYIFPALAPLALVLAGGGLRHWPERRWVPAACVAALLVAMNTVALAGLRSAFDARADPELNQHSSARVLSSNWRTHWI